MTGKQQESEEKTTKKGAFSVTFEDGTVILESKSVDTFVKSLQKIGLKRINESRCPEHSKYKLVHATDINNCKRLLVDSAAGRTNNKGTTLNSVSCPEDIKYIDNYPVHLTD